ncbi:hypothetical protein [Tardiphaga sp. 619_E2_N8_5]|jgi:hypothetical protein|uniref:hypothetical protein n=1 Tax=unclassified Tardiphaga TaxID=2631404 RepID=UPI003F227140
MITLQKLVVLASIATSAALLAPQSAKAIELAGAWATSADQCNKVFTRKGRAKQIAFTSFSGVYGGGFIAEADRLRGKHEICKIASKKESDRTINLIAACASSIMLSHVQFILNVVDENTISREFPGMVDMKVTYHRCQI